LKTNLIWITPDAESLLAYIARVSNPANQDNDNYAKLLQYMVKNQHWSPFEMVSACFEIDTTRDIARQILRHRSFSFQEFSQRYAVVSELPPVEPREARLQDAKNRQSSIETEDPNIQGWWDMVQDNVDTYAKDIYEQALEKGIAKEVARAVLPEGLTPTRMYMSGTIRSWMHYCQLRSGNGTQKEHQEIAKQISDTLATQLPESWKALMGE
jgi:thymidylate synthase (FAD)